MKCPKCEHEISSSVEMKEIIAIGEGHSYSSIAHACPHCGIILGVAPDPAAQQHDIIQGIVSQLKPGS